MATARPVICADRTRCIIATVRALVAGLADTTLRLDATQMGVFSSAALRDAGTTGVVAKHTVVLKARRCTFTVFAPELPPPQHFAPAFPVDALPPARALFVACVALTHFPLCRTSTADVAIIAGTTEACAIAVTMPITWLP